MIEKVIHNDKLMAIIIKSDFDEDGISFFTPNNFSQQLAYMHHSTGKKIRPHFHNQVPREIFFTQEVLFIKEGKIRVDFYDEKQKYLNSRILETGDLILLATGGHGFEILEETKMIEVKQGPYTGEQDKTHFLGAPDSEIIL